jgi:hypothetical protein
MGKKTTLKEIAAMLLHVVTSVGRIEEKMATKDQLASLHTQVNSIERQLRETKTEIRLGDLEEKVFGQTRR